jgi:hypothetical protein
VKRPRWLVFWYLTPIDGVGVTVGPFWTEGRANHFQTRHPVHLSGYVVIRGGEDPVKAREDWPLCRSCWVRFPSRAALDDHYDHDPECTPMDT